MGLQAEIVAQAMILHWLTVFDVSAVICSDRGTQFVGAWFCTMCKYMCVSHAKTVAYHSRWNRTVEVAAGNCSRNSGNCVFSSLFEIGIFPFGGLCRHTTVYPDRLVCALIVSFFCEI